MKTIPSLLLCSLAWSAAPAAAQQSDALNAPAPVLRMSLGGARCGIVLVSLDDRAIGIDADLVLANALAVPIASLPGSGCADVVVPAGRDLYWQIVTMVDGRMQVSRIRLHPALRGDTRLADDLGSAATDVDDSLPVDKLPLDLGVNTTMGRIDAIKASFRAPNDGYGLLVFAVKLSEAEVTDVFLWRKRPGPGEGHDDVIMFHSAVVGFPATRSVRVFLSEGTSIHPDPTAPCELIARFPR